VSDRTPTEADIDVFGLTHPGKIRKNNQDHFLIAELSREMRVNRTSLPAGLHLPVRSEHLASLAMVADGVGSGGGEEASRAALLAISQYVERSANAFYTSETEDGDQFAQILSDAAMQCHAELLERGEAGPGRGRLATTLTLWLGLWPQAYLLHVGDSRCYLFRDDQLTQISRDQTMAQNLIDDGVLSVTKAHRTRWASVLSSAIGGQEAAPTVTRIVRDWGTVVLLCSDGLYRHVSDERIGERLRNLTSSQQACETLLQDALDDGGTDNITIVIGRTIRPVDEK
jgi:serine/threonine protein phosphatase PrpC